MSFQRIGYVIVPLAVLGGATIALAQTTTTTTTTVERTAPMSLSPQQRTVIYRTVTRERRTVPPVEYRPASAVWFPRRSCSRQFRRACTPRFQRSGP